MQFLIDFAAEDDEFQRILKRSGEYAVVQGVVLDIDRLWLWLWVNKDRLPESQTRQLYYQYRDYDLFRWAFGNFRGVFGQVIFAAPLTRYDVDSWRPYEWEFLQNNRGLPIEGPPLIVRVCLRPRQTAKEVIPTVGDLYDREGQLRVEIEVRARAHLASDPRKAYSPVPGGVSIGVGAADYGTLGVVLTDAHGQRYGLTCSHVAGSPNSVWQPSQLDMSTGTSIGKASTCSKLSVCPPGVKCNPWSGATANEIDASLIEIDPNVPALLEVLDVGSLTGVMSRATMSTGQAVEVMGRTSGFNAMQIGGLAAWYNFKHGGNDYCFKNLFEVESPYGTAGIIRRGDSGAPVCAAGASGAEWAGMIVGQDAFKGYAIYAETLEQWCVGQGYSLQVQ